MTLSRRQSGDSAGVTHEVRGSVSVGSSLLRGEAALTGLSGNLRDTEMCDPVPGEEELMGNTAEASSRQNSPHQGSQSGVLQHDSGFTLELN